MHFVDCGDEPASLQPLKKWVDGKRVWEPEGKEYSDFIIHLQGRFESICAYCERRCERPPSGKKPERDQDNTVDHFKPKSCDRFPELTHSWENLVYACYRCNQAKGNKFPGKVPAEKGLIEDLIDQIDEADKYGKRFVDPSESDGYVNPRDPAEKAETFFEFSRDGKILPNHDLDNLKWSKAVRTICDFDLNEERGLNFGRAFAFALGQDSVAELARKPRERAKLERKLRESPGNFPPPKEPGESRRYYPSCSTWAFFNALSPT